MTVRAAVLSFLAGIDKGTDQPCPDRSLVVGTIAMLHIAAIMTNIIGVERGKASQTMRG